jgi:hypothetical protein
MGTPIIKDILDSTVGKVVDRLTDRLLPSSIGEKEKEELKLEAMRIASEEYTVIIFYFGGRSLEKTAETVWKKAAPPASRK